MKHRITALLLLLALLMQGAVVSASSSPPDPSPASMVQGIILTKLHLVNINNLTVKAHQEQDYESAFAFKPESGVIFMYFNGSGEGAPEELFTRPLIFTICVDDGGCHAVETTPRYAPEEIIAAFAAN